MTRKKSSAAVLRQNFFANFSRRGEIFLSPADKRSKHNADLPTAARRDTS